MLSVVKQAKAAIERSFFSRNSTSLYSWSQRNCYYSGIRRTSKPNTTLEGLTTLKPAFRFDGKGTITGNASGLNDGAAFEILTTKSIAKEKGLTALAEVVDYAITGCDPSLMGLGSQNINQVLAANNLTLDDIDVLEINEAFAGQTLGCLRELNISMIQISIKTKFNPHGGAVALGHH